MIFTLLFHSSTDIQHCNAFKICKLKVTEKEIITTWNKLLLKKIRKWNGITFIEVALTCTLKIDIHVGAWGRTCNTLCFKFVNNWCRYWLICKIDLKKWAWNFYFYRKTMYWSPQYSVNIHIIQTIVLRATNETAVVMFINKMTRHIWFIQFAVYN